MRKSEVENCHGISRTYDKSKPVLTVGFQINETLRIHRGLSKQQAKDKTIEMLKVVNMPLPEQRYNEYPHQLSEV